MTHAQLAARSKGGFATLTKYGMRDMSAIGKLGGRPRLKTIEELRAVKDQS
jgi:hypothetical protein